MSKNSIERPEGLCAERSLSLRRFIGSMEGVDSMDGENGKIEISVSLRRWRRSPWPGFPKTERLGHKLPDEE